MNDSPDRLNHQLTFAQREGAVPLPRQLALKQLPKEVSAPLWGLVFKEIDSSRIQHYWIGGIWKEILHDYWIESQNRPADEFTNRAENLIPWIKGVVLSSNYVWPLNFLEFVIRHPLAEPIFSYRVNDILTRTSAAYRVFGQSIAPISSAEEGVTIAKAFADASSGGYVGAKAHLQNAASSLTAGRYADSVRESMNAVESVARTLDSNSTTLAPALAVLEKQGHLHPAMKKGFQSLYGYTSDQQGIRHALLEGNEAAVSEADALYMFGSCAAFVSYLTRKTNE